MNGLPSVQARVLSAIQNALEEGGVELIGTPNLQPAFDRGKNPENHDVIYPQKD